MTDASIKDFYDDLYIKEASRNPAYLIYDSLRINAISELVNDSIGPVLIIGSGSNLDFSIFDSSFEVYAFDLSYRAIQNVSTNTHQKFVADALNIPLSSGYFNIVVCFKVLEYIPDIRWQFPRFDE